MKKILFLTILTMLLGLPGLPAPASQDDLQAFPSADEDMSRHVLTLAPEPDETLLKVELILGKTVLTDAANRYFFAGAIREETIPGWGYTRYVLPSLGPMAGTLMAVDPAAPNVERFVTLRGEPYLIRYNSRLPVVIYVPEGVEVRHRVWRADPATRPVPRG
jgi:ecotin